jgi:hypothetical protein
MIHSTSKKDLADVRNILYRARTIDTVKNNGSYRSSEKNVSAFRVVNLSLTYNFSHGKKVNVKRTQSIQDIQDANLKK